jgi:hypothetical protein
VVDLFLCNEINTPTRHIAAKIAYCKLNVPQSLPFDTSPKPWPPRRKAMITVISPMLATCPTFLDVAIIDEARL